MGGDGVTAGSATNALYIKDVEFSLQGEAGDNGDELEMMVLLFLRVYLHLRLVHQLTET